ncbi:lytic transglycosylase domain-containing protein [Variovorax sp. OV329]|uniref:lytic transglycosylase domain-containing protein n=1 Tax=Variovorax sp. OV329 TaxID=1882825 RepID=UPI0020C92444|nr:lytic transglycosylase domain-containing protein [Variovorax sp. OV329]
MAALWPLAQAASIYGYVDEKGVAHFASEPLDARYQLFFKAGQSFDTAAGLPGAGAGRGGSTAAQRSLLAMFDASPGYRNAKRALRDAAHRHDIDYELLQALVATESGFDPQAVSPKGALGLMQVMPDTAARYGVRGDARATVEAKLFDPRQNVATGSRYLADLIVLFPGRLDLALAAYNAGEGAVQKAGNRIPNYPETRNYVATVMQLYAYLKPEAALRAGTGGGKPGRVRMELAGPKGGAIGRGNVPPPGMAMPAAPALPETP